MPLPSMRSEFFSRDVNVNAVTLVELLSHASVLATWKPKHLEHPRSMSQTSPRERAGNEQRENTSCERQGSGFQWSRTWKTGTRGNRRGEVAASLLSAFARGVGGEEIDGEIQSMCLSRAIASPFPRDGAWSMILLSSWYVVVVKNRIRASSLATAPAAAAANMNQ